MTTMIQDKDGKTAAKPSTMPSDRHFRNAWKLSGSVISEDMTEAKKIFKDKIREVRKPLLEAEDVVYMKALEANDASAKTASVKKKKAKTKGIIPFKYQILKNSILKQFRLNSIYRLP